MNRVKCCRLLLALIIVFSIGVGATAQTAPSVPNLIAYQGRVTLSGGSPVADGSYPAIFEMYNNSSGGASLWTESASIATTGGIFSHNLGSVTALPTTLTVANDSLWLAITFNGELLTPRTRVVGNAFSLASNSLEMDNGSGTVALRTTPTTNQLSQFGIDGGEQIRLWGAGWGELYLDAAAVNASTDDVRLTSNNGNGGRLDLRKSGGINGVSLHGGLSGTGATLALTNDAGSTTVFLDGDQTGDVAVQIPAASVSATEQFNEPGVAANNSPDTIPISGLGILVGRIITVPAAGYVIATGSLMLRSNHALGTVNNSRFWIEDTSNFIRSLESEHFLSATLPTGGYSDCIYVQSVFSVPAGPTGFTLRWSVSSGNHEVTVPHLALTYVPTAYGTVAAPSAANTAQSSEHGLSAKEFDAERIQLELAEVRAQAEATTRRLAELESQMAKSQTEP